MTSTSGAGVRALLTFLVLSLLLILFSARKVQAQSTSALTATDPSTDAVDIKITQTSSKELEIRAKMGELQARLSLFFKDQILMYSVEPRTGRPADEWPWFVDAAPLLEACLHTAVSDPSKLPNFRFVTRLAMYPEMSARIAFQAGTSRKWDQRFGRPKTAFTNSFVMGLAKDSGTYPELESLFAEKQLQIQLESLERVSIEKVRNLPFHDILTAEGLSSEWLVPYDAVLRFSVKYAR